MAGWRESGGLGIFCGRKNLLGRAVFQLFRRKIMGKVLESRFFSSFEKVWEKLSHKNAIKMTWGVIFKMGKISGGFWPFLAGKRAVSDSELLVTLFVTNSPLNYCHSWNKNCHLWPRFQRPRQLNQTISWKVFKAKVFCIFTKNWFQQPSSSFGNRKSRFLAA